MEWLQTFDIGVLQWLRETLSTPFMDKLMVLISTLGNAGALWLFLGVLFLIMGIRRKNWREMGILLLLCVGASALVCNLILKPCVNRIRPYDLLGYVDALLIPPLHDASFPSGHTAACFAAATAVCAKNRAWGFAAYIFGAVMGFSRLYLGVHFPTDVLAGAAVGTAMAALTVRLFRKHCGEDSLQK